MFPRPSLVALFLAACCGLAGCSRPRGGRERARTYSFCHPPYIHPKIIQDLTTWLSDSGDQVVAVNLLESQSSNRYFGEVRVRKAPGKFPFVYVKERKEEFGYRYVGTTTSGIHVLYTSYSGGGTGVFTCLMLVTFERDKGITTDWKELRIRPGRKRLLLKKLGEVGLGDRWDGDLKVKGNEIFVGKDRGWFTVSGGTGGGWLSYDRKDRVLKIEVPRR